MVSKWVPNGAGFFILLTLIAGGVRADSNPISPRLDSLRAAVYAQLNVSATGTTRLTAAKVRYALNRAQAVVATDFPAVEKSDTVVLLRSSEGGLLNSDFLRLYRVFKVRSDSLRYPMTVVPLDSLALLNPSIPQAKGDITSPNFCWSYRGRLFTHPKVITTSETFYVDYFGLPERMEYDTSTCQIKPEYLEAVVDYACGLLSATRELYDEANWYFQKYQGQKQPTVSREMESKQ